MTKIIVKNTDIHKLPSKYCQAVFVQEKEGWHRLVETKEGHLEYRLGIGKTKDLTKRKFKTLIRTLVQGTKSHRVTHLALSYSDLEKFESDSLSKEWLIESTAKNLVLAAYEFKAYKTKKKNENELQEIILCGKLTADDKEAFDTGLTIATAVNETRDIANHSGEDMTPSKLAAAVKRIMRGTKASVKVLDTQKIKSEKMGLLEVVGKAAPDKPKLIVIEYFGAGENSKQKPVVLVGKGITYDTGGLNVKPSGAMHEMHMDMAGGASVIGALKAAAKLGLKKNVIGIIPAAENAVGERSMRAGDIATSMSGQTVEILHTDAEGRLVLADGLTYAQKHYKPSLILDVATLTGASLVALGQHASAIMTKDHELQEALVEAGEDSGDLVWPLPLWEEYKQYLKSSRADISNIATNFSRYGGTIEGGTFLSFFVDTKIPWAHIDIAPRMNSIASDKLAKGATGEPVQLLVEMLRN